MSSVPLLALFAFAAVLNAVILGVVLMWRGRRSHLAWLGLMFVCIGFLLSVYTLEHYDRVWIGGWVRVMYDLVSLLLVCFLLEHVCGGLLHRSPSVLIYVPVVAYFVILGIYRADFLRAFTINHLILVQSFYTVAALVVVVRARRGPSPRPRLRDRTWLHACVVTGAFLVVHFAHLVRVLGEGRWRLDTAPVIGIAALISVTLYALTSARVSAWVPPRPRLEATESRTLIGALDRVMAEHRLFARPDLDLAALAEADGDTSDAPDGIPATAARVGREGTVRFRNEGAELVGRLNLPDGDGPHPAIVIVHGSGEYAGSEFMYNGDFFGAHGIAAMTFDKRGTGRSSGEYTFDFHQLARDVVAAVRHLQQRPDIDAGRIGLSGYSQGGWVAPLAASMCPEVRFVLVSCGLVESPAEEARVETRLAVGRRGVDAAALDQLDELTRAAVDVIASDFKDGWAEFEAVKRKTRGAPWREKLDGTVIGQFVRYPKWLIKILGPRKSPRALPWHYDSHAVFDSLDVPMVWFIAGDDGMAPNDLAIPALRNYAGAGKPIELVVYPGTDHGMLVFHERDGKRVYTGYAPNYFRQEASAALRLAETATDSTRSFFFHRTTEIGAGDSTSRP